MIAREYLHVTGPEPHVSRGRQILAAHPDLRQLAGPMPQSAFWTGLLVAMQLGMAWLVGRQPWYIWLPCAYIVGATIDHALWVLIHECSHNLVFRARAANRITALVANIPILVPAAMPFCKYHLLHHRFMGDLDLDADIPGPMESRVVGRSVVRKTIWVALLGLLQGSIRPMRMRTVGFLDGWNVLNVVTQAVAIAGLVWWLGGEPMKYLGVSTVVAIGLHPLGARWIQEHYVFKEGQETYSYYGPLNRVAFNVGYHNEHHDLITVPWAKLPLVRKRAPEFYDDLMAHRSWSALLVRFVMDRDMTLFRRYVRP